MEKRGRKKNLRLSTFFRVPFTDCQLPITDYSTSNGRNNTTSPGGELACVTCRR